MTAVLILFLVQGAFGAADTLWHHELQAHLPSRPGARRELALHAAREAIYAIVFLSLGWFVWSGVWAIVLASLLGIEVLITLEDFLVEDRTRRLPPSERVLHTVMAIGFGAVLTAFAPVLFGWAQGPNALRPASYGLLSWLMTGVGIGVLAWAVRDGWAAISLKAEPPTQASPADGRTVLITGATGFIGSALVRRLQSLAWRVIVLARDPLVARARFGANVLVLDGLDQLPAETRIDAIVNLAGASIAGGRWTSKRREALLHSRINTTRALVGLIVRLRNKPDVLVSASGIGFYGDRQGEIIDETAGGAAGFMSQLCHRWEDAAAVAEVEGVRVCRLRLGLVLDWSGGILPMLALPARLGLGAVVGGGRQWMAWIHLDDVLAVIQSAIEDRRFCGPINLVAPEQVTQGEFTRALAFSLGRPQWLTAPAWPLRLALGEMSDLLLASQRAMPMRLSEMGFEFSRPDLGSALSRATPLRSEPPRAAPRRRLLHRHADALG